MNERTNERTPIGRRIADLALDVALGGLMGAALLTAWPTVAAGPDLSGSGFDGYNARQAQVIALSMADADRPNVTVLSAKAGV